MSRCQTVSWQKMRYEGSGYVILILPSSTFVHLALAANHGNCHANPSWPSVVVHSHIITRSSTSRLLLLLLEVGNWSLDFTYLFILSPAIRVQCVRHSGHGSYQASLPGRAHPVSCNSSYRFKINSQPFKPRPSGPLSPQPAIARYPQSLPPDQDFD